MRALLYEINTRVLLRSASERLGRAATLDDVENALLHRLAAQGFDWVWLLGVWRTGAAGRRISREIPELREAYRRALPDLTEADICGSCFAITGYEVEPEMGGEAALLRFRERLHRRGMRLMLDFVPNHTATDHPWARERPQLYRRGGADELSREPRNYLRLDTAGGPAVLAHGRDPNFPGWTDTLQLDYSKPDTIAAVTGELLRVARLCDGLRCDMAMLLLPETFGRTWGTAALPFWPQAIGEVRREQPGFTFLAEAYWDLEWELMRQGFDYAYDKRLYDRLRAGAAEPVRAHLGAELAFQERLARFLENHDEERAAAAFPIERHRAAALVTYLAPGLKFLHEGQLEGRRVRLPVQLCRAPDEPEDAAIAWFYEGLLRLLKSPALREGSWRLRQTGQDAIVAFDWSAPEVRLIAVVNFGAAPARYALPAHELSGNKVRLLDPDGWRIEERRADELALDLSGWGARLVEVSRGP
jgi:glycosidase